MKITEFKKNVDREILSFFDSKLSTLPSYDKKTFQHLRKILAGGKRIRSYIAFLSYKANAGTNDKNAIKLLSFIEVFHAFCLVHDDIMDKAEKRHGVKTIQEFIDRSSDFGNSYAMLIGDFLFSWSWEILLTNNGFERKTIERIQQTFLKMTDEVLSGQALDLNISKKHTATDEEIIKKMLLKTAGYSFTYPMIIGAKLAKGNIDEKSLRKLGSYLGLAFQIQDDLLEIKFDAKQIKKTAFIDIAQHQHTLLSNYISKNGTVAQKRILKDLFGKKLTENDMEKLRKIFFDSGAIEFGEKEVIKNLNRAREIIEEIKIQNKYRKLFLELINDLGQRSS